MLQRDPEAELLGYCADHQIGVVAYSPMASGLLTGKYTRAKIANLPAEDWRTTKSDHFREPGLSANLELVDSLRVIAERSGRSLGNLALAWVLRRPEMTSAILGARHPGQIAENLTGQDFELPAEDQAEIEALLQRRQARILAG